MPENDDRDVTQAKTHIPWWAWPHVLSLEAPVVAVLWQDVLAKVHRVSLTPGTTVGLALAVWLVYILDRWLDGQDAGTAQLDGRHAFYARHSRVIGALALPVLIVVVAWLGLYIIPVGVLWSGVALSLLIGIYLGTYAMHGRRSWVGLIGAFVGLGSVVLILELPIGAGVKLQLALVGLLVMTFGFFRRHRTGPSGGFPKEILGSLLFALGCSLGVQFFTMGEGFVMLTADTMLIWGLFAMNLIGISCVEHEAGGGDAETVPVLWPRVGRAYPYLLVALIAFSIQWLSKSGSPTSTSSDFAFPVASALMLLGILWAVRRRLPPLLYRVLVDLALVMPAAWFLVTRN